MKISYYELLDMVKAGAEPKRIRVKICSYPCEYIAEYDGEDFNFYRIADGYSEDENYEYYLTDCFLESTMFDKCIEIIEEVEEDEFEDIEEINNNEFCMMNKQAEIFELYERVIKLIKNQKKIIEQLNYTEELESEIKHLKEEMKYREQDIEDNYKRISVEEQL